MSKRNAVGWVLGIGWMCIMLGTSLPMIGKIGDCPDMWTGWDSFALVIILLVPFIAGHLASKDFSKEETENKENV